MTTHKSLRRVFLTGISFAAAAVLLSSGSAFAEPHTHDGFFLNMSLGPGIVDGSISAAGSSSSLDLESNGITGQLQLGGTISPGIVLGGSTAGFVMFNPTVEGTDVRDLQLSVLSLFIRIYPDPAEGLFFGGQLGFASLSEYDRNDEADSAQGGTVGANIGYDWWVGEEWSVGVEGRLLYASVEEDLYIGTLEYTMFAPSIMFSASYH